jgi:cytochrome c biogenesis protein CcmG/thiol:disulfide interchange protein DsbE
VELRRLLSVRGRALVASAAVVFFVIAVSQRWGIDGTDGGATVDAIGQGTPVSVDRPAPAFSQPLLSGHGSLSLRRYDGEVVVVNFWASSCTACRLEVPQLDGLWRAYGGRGVRFVGVDYQDGRAAAVNFSRSLGMGYPSVFDPSGRVGNDYGIFGLPTTYIIAPDDRIRYVVYGRINPASFRVALESLLKPTPSETAGR